MIYKKNNPIDLVIQSKPETRILDGVRSENYNIDIMNIIEIPWVTLTLTKNRIVMKNIKNTGK